MSARGLERLLWGALAVACLLHLVSWSDPTRRNSEFLPDMVAAVPYESQSPNPVFPDGKTHQPPPEGTIPRGHPPLRSGGVLLDTRTKWEELAGDQQEAWLTLAPSRGEPDPAAEARVMERGRVLFGAFCAACHGGGGLGDGAVTKRGVPPPPSLLGDAARGFPDARLFRIITAGRGNMPAYATQIEREDRWKVVRYVRNLQSGG